MSGPQSPCTPRRGVFDMTPLHVNTSFFDAMAMSPSMNSSSPTTPHYFTDSASMSDQQPGACSPFDILSPFEVLNTDGFNNQTIPHTSATNHPVTFTSDTSLCDPIHQPHFPLSEPSYLPLKSDYSYHKADAVHMGISFTDFIAQPLSGYIH